MHRIVIPWIGIFHRIFYLFCTLLVWNRRLQYHGMITTGGLGNGFPTSIWPKIRKEKHCVSSSLRQEETALRLSWERWWWRWWWWWKWLDIHVRQDGAWRNPSAERQRQRLEGVRGGRERRFVEIQRDQVSVWVSGAAAWAPPAVLPHSIWRRASTNGGRAHRGDRACFSAPADHPSPLDLHRPAKWFSLHPPNFPPFPCCGVPGQPASQPASRRSRGFFLRFYSRFVSIAVAGSGASPHTAV